MTTKKIYLFPVALCALGVWASFGPTTRKAHAQDGSMLIGGYACQFTGTVFLPSPLDSFNGTFYRNARPVFDGQGGFSTTSAVANYDGNVSTESFSGTYTVAAGGIVDLEIPNLGVPFLPPGTPDVFSFNGVLADGGKIMKIVLTGVSVGGMAQPNIGSVIAGECVRQ
jgi:hypothetical protein